MVKPLPTEVIRARWRAGETQAALAREFNVSDGAIRYRIHKGLKPVHSKCNVPAHILERNKQIIALREKDGLTYQEIANIYNISRERVRQILVKNKRQDLLALWSPVRVVSPHYKPKNKRPCPSCGAYAQPNRTYCSWRCFKFAKRTDKIKRVRPAIQLRLKGYTWREAAETLGGKFAAPQGIQLLMKEVKEVYRELGLSKKEIAIVFPGSGNRKSLRTYLKHKQS